MPLSAKHLILGTFLVAQAGCVINVKSGSHSGRNIDKVFGSIDVDAGEIVGDVETVNGRISLDDNVVAEVVETVNGSIDLGDNVEVRDASTTNGSIKTGENLTVTRDLETVNGSIRVNRNGDIRGSIETVNGSIMLRGSRVGQDVETLNGDIDIVRGSVVEGDVIFNENGNNWGNDNDPPRLRIDAESAVKGSIRLYREVRLDIDPDAEVGEIVEFEDRGRW